VLQFAPMETFFFAVAIVGVLAFIFAIPMSILANAYTPKILFHWSLTSIRRIESRILKLEQSCRWYRIMISASVRQTNYIRSVRLLFYALAGTVVFVLALVLIGATWIEQVILGFCRSDLKLDIATESRLFYLAICWFAIVAAIIVEALIFKAILAVRRASKIMLVKGLVNAEMEIKELEAKWKKLSEIAFIQHKAAFPTDHPVDKPKQEPEDPTKRQS